MLLHIYTYLYNIYQIISHKKRVAKCILFKYITFFYVLKKGTT